jgi:hypothetical protein
MTAGNKRATESAGGILANPDAPLAHTVLQKKPVVLLPPNALQFHFKVSDSSCLLPSCGAPPERGLRCRTGHSFGGNVKAQILIDCVGVKPEPRVKGKRVEVEQAGNKPHRLCREARPLQGDLNHGAGNPASRTLRLSGDDTEGKVCFPLVDKTDPRSAPSPPYAQTACPGSSAS